MRRPSSPPPRRRAEPGRPPGPGRNPLRLEARPPGERTPEARVHERDLVCICGLSAVLALCSTDLRRVERLFFEPRLAAELKDTRRLLGKVHKPYRTVEAAELAKIAGTVRHGGVVAVARPRPILTFDPAHTIPWAREKRPLLILDGIGNPHNLGAIARSAAFFGVQRILLADRPDQALPSAASYRIAEGALDRVSLCRGALTSVLPALKPGFRIVGTALAQGVPLASFHSNRPVALVVGNEESGIDPATLALCDAIVTIPGSGQVQSLNVAAAVSVLLYALGSPAGTG